MRIIFFLLTLIFTAVIIVVGVSFIAQFLKNFQPGKSRVAEDVEKMKAALQLFINDLVPWKNEELDLLSFNQINKKISKGLIKTGQGVITSIYHEPMIAWSYKRYVGGGDNAVIYASTSHHEFVFRIRNKGTFVMIDNEDIGEIRNNGVLYSVKTDRLLARINKESSKLALPILIGDKEVATLKSQDYVKQTNARAFELIADMNKEEEAILLSLTILEMVTEEFD